MTSDHPILLLEDDDVDAMKVARVLKELAIPCKLVRVENGEDGLTYLRDGTQPKPCLIFTDISMPRMTGLEFLQAVKEEPALRAIPLVVLTASGEDRDRRTSLALGAAGFLIKPPDYESFLEMMRTAKTEWALFRV